MILEPAQHKLVLKLTARLGRKPQPREIAREVLLEGSFLIHAEYSDGTVKQYIHSVNDEWHIGVKRDLEAQFATTVKEFKGYVKGISQYAHITRKTLQVFDHSGSNISFKDLGNHVRREDVVITFKKILKSWGIKDKTDWELNRGVIENLVPDRNVIEVKKPPNEEQFLKLMEKWYEEGIPTTITKLYHGCYSYSIPSILMTGLEVRDDRGGNASGAGVYLGRTDKAQNYAESGERSSSKKWWKSKSDDKTAFPYRFLLECEVMLGRVYQAQTPLHGKAAAMVRENKCQSLTITFNRQEWTVYDANQVIVRRIIRL